MIRIKAVPFPVPILDGAGRKCFHTRNRRELQHECSWFYLSACSILCGPLPFVVAHLPWLRPTRRKSSRTLMIRHLVGSSHMKRSYPNCYGTCFCRAITNVAIFIIGEMVVIIKRLMRKVIIKSLMRQIVDLTLHVTADLELTTLGP